MTKRSVPTAIEELLVSNSEFEYAHLIKFERPFPKDPKTGNFRTNANRYAYFTDASRNISFNDGSTDHDSQSNGSQLYRANRVKSIGSYSETTSPRATNMALTLSGDHLGTSLSITGDFGSAAFTVATSFHDDADATDLVDFGFREGDKVKITKNLGNFSTGVNNVTYIITGFASDNRKMTFATTGNDSDDTTTYPTDSGVSVTITLESEEIKAVLNDKATTSLANPSFLNREVFIHKVFIDPETGDILGNSSILIFKGIIAGCSIDEGPTKSNVKWSLTSHWGDWSQVGGRMTTDDTHRALDANDKPDIDMALKPEYTTDLGFLHSETTLSAIANYKTYETEIVYKSKKRGGLAGLLGGTKMTSKEVQKEIDNEVDLSIGLQGKYLPVVYGVQRLPGIPVFADTANTDSKKVFVADAICEGEIHGLYNLYIDGVPLICTDANDADVRSATSTTTNADGTLKRDEAALQCYGRADLGTTLGGAVDTAVATSLSNFAATFAASGLADVINPTNTDPSEIRRLQRNLMAQINYWYGNVVTDNIPVITTSDAEGLSHTKHGAISHPHNMSFTFFKGSNDQRASNLLVTQAQAGFKRQSDYYDSTIPYWSPDHKLLDTAYMVNAFTINADSTEIPELEYVVRGRVLECYNFDNSYVHDAIIGASDAHTNFKEGDTVTVQRSTNGTSWENTTVEGSSSDSSFRILHKYLLTENDGTSEYRLLLDQTPDLDAVDGEPTKTYLRIKKDGAAQYWHMRTWNFNTISNAAFTLYMKSPTAVAVNGSNEIQLTFDGSSGADAANLKAGYETELATNGPAAKATYSFHINSCSTLASIQDASIAGTWSGNTLTLKGVKYNSDDHNSVAIGSVPNILSIGVYKNRNFYMGGSGQPFEPFTVADALAKETITLRHTGETRKITAFDQTNKRIEIDQPFTTLTETQYDAGDIKFDVSGKFDDKRAVTNTALQLLDYMKDRRYGKDLKLNKDLDLASFISSAKLCEVRGTLTLGTNTAGITVGDYYKLADDSGNHLGSGRVASVATNKVTFEQLSGKFVRRYGNHLNYLDDEFVLVDDARLYKKSGAGYLTKPTHTTGTSGGATYVSSGAISLTKESGSGPSSIAINLLVPNGATGADTNLEPDYSIYDSDFVKYWRYMGWEHHKQCFVTRHQTNFIIDTSKSIFENMNVFLSHMNGMLSYEAGKYVLDIETQATAPTSSNTFNSVTYDWNVNPEYIDNTDIIGSISLTDNSARNAKNTIKASITDPQNNWSSRSVSFFDSKFLEADRKVIKTGNFNYTGITNYYNARLGTQKELIGSRFSREISFKVGPKGLLLKAGQVISLSYEPFGFSSKLFRINNLNFNPDCSVSIKATEYDDSMYTIRASRANELRKEAATQAAPLAIPSAPTGLSASIDKPGSVILNWTNPTDFVDQSDDIEIWASNDNNRANVGDKPLYISKGNVTTFTFNSAGAGTKFFWARTRRLSKFNRGNTLLTSAYHPTSATGGVTGTARILSPDIQLNHGGINFMFDSDGALDPAGANQDVTVTATLQNLSGTPTFSITEADGSSQADVTFTTGATSLTASSATVDASSASSSTSPKLLKVTITDTGETFTRQVPIGIITSGSGSPGAAGLRTIQGYLYYEKSSSPNTAPSAPSGNTYTFGTGLVTGTGISTATNQPNDVWLNSFNTANATSANVHYTVRYYGTESSAGSSTISVAYSNVVQHTSFTGVVTFSGGTFATVGGNNITTIDGGNIDTDTITADKIKLSGSGSLAITSLSGTLPKSQGGTGASDTAGLVSILNAAGLTLTSSLGTAATASVSSIREGTTKGDVDLGNVQNEDTRLSAQFSAVTRLAAGSLFLGTTATNATTNYIEISAANGGQIIIADDS